MRTLLLLLAGISVLSVGNKSKAINLNDVQPVVVECPECTKKFNECLEPIYKTYAEEVEKAADKLKAGKISKKKYLEFCEEARKVRNKPDAACVAEYNKCCLAETKEIMEKNKKEEQ